MPNGWDKLLITMGFTYVAFEGFEVIAQAGDETIDPRRNLPKAMIYSIFIVVFTYVGVAFAAIVGVKGVGMAPWQWIGSFGAKGFGEAVSQLIPSYGNILVTITVICVDICPERHDFFSHARVIRLRPGPYAAACFFKTSP